MSTTIAALIVTLIVTGMTSSVDHQLTLIGGCGASVLFAMCAMVSRNATMYLPFIFGSIAMSTIALVSSESNSSEFSSTIHNLCSYVALIALGFSSRDLSSFCRQTMLMTNLLLTAWILYQGQYVDSLSAWKISNPSGTANMMPAQINMTLGLILSRLHETTGPRRTAYGLLLATNCVAVFYVMSRNGIGTLLVLLTLYVLFNYKRLATIVLAMIATGGVMLDQILNVPFIREYLVRMRIIGYEPKASRSLIWEISADHIMRNPWLGVGPGEPRKILAVLDINNAHNNIIQVAFESGIPAAVILTGLTAVLLWMPVSMVFRQREYFVHTMPIIAYFMFSWTGGPLQFPNATLLLAICVNEARLAVDRQNRKPQIADPEQNASGKRLRAA